jgi:NADH dehydrogenase
MIAPVAVQQGTAAALNILKQVEGKEPQPFKYFDKGAMAKLGRRPRRQADFHRLFRLDRMALCPSPLFNRI